MHLCGSPRVRAFLHVCRTGVSGSGTTLRVRARGVTEQDASRVGQAPFNAAQLTQRW